MAKTASDKPTASAEERLKRRKKQARQEAKLMLEIEEAKKDLKKAQKKQSKAQARLEARSTYVQTLEARLAELRAQSLEPEIAAPPQSAELEQEQEQAELASSIGSSNGKQLASPETGASTSTDEEQHPPVVEETTPTEAIVATKEMIERQAVQNQETATESDTSPTPLTPEKAPAPKTAGVRTSTATKRPTSQSTVTKRSASRSQSTKRPDADAE
jgi:hypothetical protein